MRVKYSPAAGEAGGRGCSHLAYGGAKKRWYKEHGWGGGKAGRGGAERVLPGEAGRRLKTSAKGDIQDKITPMQLTARRLEAGICGPELCWRCA